LLLLAEAQMGEAWEPSNKSCALTETGSIKKEKDALYLFIYLFIYLFRGLRKCLENYKTQQGCA
jgi:hypothetical protein